MSHLHVVVITLSCSLVFGCDASSSAGGSGLVDSPGVTSSSQTDELNQPDEASPQSERRPTAAEGDFRIIFEPNQELYEPGDVIGYAFIGANGRVPLDDLNRAACVVEPTGLADVLTDAKLRIASEGEGQLRCCLGTTCDIVSLRSNIRPSLTIDSPINATMLTGEPLLSIIGTARDPSDSLAVFVNGIPAVIEPDGRFTQEVTPRFGLNTIEVEVSDGVHTPGPSQTIEVIWAPAYAPTDANGGALNGPIEATIHQSLVDSGDSIGSLGVGNHEVSTIGQTIEAFVQAVDLGSFLDGALFVSSDALRLGLQDVRVVAPTDGLDFGLNCFQPTCVSIDIVDGGLDIAVRIPNLELDTFGAVHAADDQFSLDGTLKAAIFGFVRVGLRIVDGALQLSTADESLTVNHLDGTYTDPLVQGLLNAVDPNPQALNQQIRRLMEALLLPVLRREVKTLTGFAFNAVNSVTSSIPVRLDPLDPAQDPQAFTVSIEPASVEFTTGGKIVLSSSLSVVSSRPLMSSPGDLGVPVMATSNLAPDVPHLAQASIELTALNLVAHTLWRSGLFGGALPLPTDIAPLVTEVTVDPLLPPVIVAGSGSMDFDLIAQLGAWRVSIKPANSESSIPYALSIEAGVDIESSGEIFSATFAETPSIRLRVLGDDEAIPLGPEQIARLIQDSVWPSVRENLHSVFLYELGPIVLDTPPFPEIAPRLASLSFVPTLGESISASGGRLTAGGRIALQLEIAP